MSRFLAALLVLALAGPGTLAGQTSAKAATLAPGARVRIASVGAKPRIATLVAHTGDTLVVRWPEFTSAVAVPLADVSLLEVSTGRSRRVLKGLMWGTVAGGTAGAVIGAASYQPCDSTEFFGCFLEPKSRSEAVAWGGAAGGVLGLVVGSLAGLAKHEDWQRVSLERRVAVGVAPSSRGTRLGVTIVF